MFNLDRLPNQKINNEGIHRPHLLDVVKVNGRWAQVQFAGNHITYLSDGVMDEIDWKNYVLKKDWKGLSVSTVKKVEVFSDEEIAQIHWDPEEKEHPKLKEQVSVYGEFEKITK